MDMTKHHAVCAARAEAQKMQAAVGGVSADAQVDMKVSQFLLLAELITMLCDLVPEPDGRSFGDPRYWVPLEFYVRVHKAALQAKAECSQLRAMVQSSRLGSFSVQV